jgi:hypothetical protein
MNSRRDPTISSNFTISERGESMHEKLRPLRAFYLVTNLALIGSSTSPAAAQESYAEMFEQGIGVPEHAVVEAAEAAQIGAGS